ncbi:plexin A3 [Manduca sexta]|uniref:Sema domain-containing protein n=1 Tax=Manduca sexta TaxID=7130 RepID=A0A921ZAJ0_MANSE|nr:plexin A3 [Manduca sexta]KAG6453851.1 hypothetical protein O3G_MSEX008361 [Manduca sexta]
MTQVMYVGVTFTNNSPYRSEVPIVSSRSLDDDRLFMIARSEVDTGTQMFVNSLSRERYLINYVYGFSSDGFSYFLTTQLRGVGSETFYSKLVRVCQDDEDYYSYTEIPIFCTGEGEAGGNFEYNLVQAAFVGKAGSVLAAELGITAQHDVLFAAFSQSESINTNTPSNLSALCVYSLKAIRRKFMLNIKNCFSGNGPRGLDFISPSYHCISTRMRAISEEFCGLPVNTPLGGENPVETKAVVIFKKRLTAVTATAIVDNTVVFAGTAQGHLKKFLVKDAFSAIEYGDIIVDEGFPINKDLVFDTQQMHLYVMTERKVSKVKVHQCSEHKNCISCVAVRDPYCEWCENEKKCGPRTQCILFDVNNTHCSYNVHDTPVGRTTESPLRLMVENIPSGEVELLCVYTLPTLTIVLNATRHEYGVDCLTPDSEKLPRAPVGLHEYTVKLSLATIKGSELAATKITIFACSSYVSCTQCTNSPYNCNWDLVDSICIDAAGQDNTMIVSNTVSIEQDKKMTVVCPKLLAPQRIWVPAGIKVNVKVKVQGIRPNMTGKLYCLFKVEARTMAVAGNFHDNVVRCDDAILNYESSAPMMSASLTIAWDEWKRLDNPQGVHLKIYKCAVMASDERSCHLLPKTYKCKWTTKGTCEHQITRVNDSETLTTIDSVELR